MRIKHIAVISLILIAASGCRKKNEPAAAPAASLADTTEVPATEVPMTETPTTTVPLSEVRNCQPNNPILIDYANPGGFGNLGDTCVFYDGTTSGGAVLTWNWKAPNAKKFKVEFTGFVPSSPIPTYPYPLAINCPGTQNTCVSGPIVTNSTKGVAYYKVTTEAPVQVFNGRIIIDR